MLMYPACYYYLREGSKTSKNSQPVRVFRGAFGRKGSR